MKFSRLRACASYPFSSPFCLLLAIALVCALTATAAQGQQQLIFNGGFEEEPSGIGWGVSRTSAGSWFLSNVGDATPQQGNPTSANGGGQGQYAVSDQSGPAITVLLQDFVVPTSATSVILSFDMFVNDFSGQSGLNLNQHARVDILNPSADPFTIDNGVIHNVYIGTDGGPNPNDFIHYAFDITTFVSPESLYSLRFMQWSSISRTDVINQGVDNISILSVPEPNTIGLAGLGVTVLALRRRRRNRD